jgi:hypothetical protein
MFNFDLNKIESVLKRERIAHVGEAADLNELRAKPVQTATLIVLPLDEDNEHTGSVTGEDTYKVTEIFAVVIVLPTRAGNRQSVQLLNELRERIKTALAGLAFDGYEPIKLHRGRIVEMNRETKNLIYQCQFVVTGYTTVTARPVL